MPKGYITEQFPLHATMIEEATVRGNLLFHNDVYTTQLQRSADQLSEYTIPSINDQLTNAYIRSGQILHTQDINTWEQHEVFQLGLNLVWALLHIHHSSLGDKGSLTYFFALLEKTRLRSDHPDYYTLLAALTQILDGLILNAWQTECSYKKFTDFAASKLSLDHLLEIAGRIILHMQCQWITSQKEQLSKMMTAQMREVMLLKLHPPSTRSHQCHLLSQLIFLLIPTRTRLIKIFVSSLEVYHIQGLLP